MMNSSSCLIPLLGAAMLLGACGSAPPPPISYVEPTPACMEQWVHMPVLINFPTSGATMESTEREILRQMVVSASQRSDIVRVRAEGHTDTCGSELGNVMLSERRARSVASELVAMNVPAGRIDTVGYGSARPRATEHCGRNERASRETNRRVEFSLLVCR